MKIDDLQLGDIIKYSTSLERITPENTYTATITDITGDKLRTISYGSMSEYANPVWIRKDQVVAKLIPKPIEFGEIKINSCNICNNYTTTDRNMINYVCGMCILKLQNLGFSPTTTETESTKCIYKYDVVTTEQWVDRDRPHEIFFDSTTRLNGYGIELKIYERNATTFQFGESYSIEIKKK